MTDNENNRRETNEDFHGLDPQYTGESGGRPEGGDLKFEGEVRVDLTPNAQDTWGKPQTGAPKDVATAAKKTEKQSVSEKYKLNRLVLENVLLSEISVSQQDKEKKKATEKGYQIAAGIGVVFVALFLIWLILNERAVFPWELKNLELITHYREMLLSGNIFALLRSPLNEYFMPQPPAFYWLMALLNLFKVSLKWVLFVNSLFFVLLSVSVYSIVRQARYDYNSWLAAAAACAFPFVFDAAKTVSPDLMLYSLVAASYACFMRSTNFTDSKYTVLFTVCVSLGCLTGWTFFLYTIPLIGMYLWTMGSFVSSRKLMLLSIAVFGSWLIMNMGAAVGAISTHAFLSAGSAASALSPLGVVFWYFWSSASALGIFLFMWAVFCIVWLLTSKSYNFEYSRELLVWMFLPYLVLTVLPNKSAVFYYGALLPCAVVIGLMTIKKARIFVIAVLAVTAFINVTEVLAYKYVPLFGHKLSFFGTHQPTPVLREPAVIYRQMRKLSGGEFAVCGLYGVDPLLAKSAALKYSAANVEFSEIKEGGVFMPKFIIAAKEDAEPMASSFSAYLAKYYDTSVNDISAANKQYSLYALKKFAKPNVAKLLKFKYFNAGGYIFEDLAVDLGTFNEGKGWFDNVVLSAKIFEKNGIDITAPVLKLEKFSFTADNYASMANFRITGLKKVYLLSGLLSEYSIARYMLNANPHAHDIQIQVEPNRLVYIDSGVPYDRSSILSEEELAHLALKGAVAHDEPETFVYAEPDKSRIYFDFVQTVNPTVISAIGSWRNYRRFATGYYRRFLPSEVQVNFTGHPEAERPFEVDISPFQRKNGYLLIGSK